MFAKQLKRKCPECGREVGDYCNPCNSAHFRDNFANWTSDDSNMDKLIQNSQLNANTTHQLIEWIEYSNLEIIDFVAQGGFGKVYKAIWKDGHMEYWDSKNNQWNRSKNRPVALKCLHNSQDITAEFLREVSSFFF